MDDLEQKKLVKKIEVIMPLFAAPTGYDLTSMKRLKGLFAEIKRFAIRTTAIHPAIKKIYRKFAPGSYFLTTYAATSNFKKALAAYKLTELWGGYIQFEDLFYEHGKKEYRDLAYVFRGQAVKKLDSRIKKEMAYTEDILQRYWLMETAYKKLLQVGHVFTDSEIRKFILLKARSIQCYSVLLKKYCQIPDTFVRFINYNQAIYNFYDDYWDLKEDLDDKAPNTFILALVNAEEYTLKNLRKLTRVQIVALIKKKEVWMRLQKIACGFKNKAEKIKLPAAYQFWNFLPRFNYEFFELYF